MVHWNMPKVMMALSQVLMPSRLPSFSDTPSITFSAESDMPCFFRSARLASMKAAVLTSPKV